MTRYFIAFVFGVACIFASQAGVLPNPQNWNYSFGWKSQVEIQGDISSKDVVEINLAVQSYGRGESKPLKAIREEGTDRIFATYQGKQWKVEGTGGMMCGSGSTYTLVKKKGSWKVVEASFWFG